MRRLGSPSMAMLAQPLGIGFAERTAGALELPARAAATAREHSLAPGVGANQLRHRRQRPARRAMPAQPLVVVSPGCRTRSRPDADTRAIAVQPHSATTRAAAPVNSEMRRAARAARRPSARPVRDRHSALERCCQQRHAGQEVRPVVIPVWNGRVEDLDLQPPRDRPARRGQRVGRRYECASSHES